MIELYLALWTEYIFLYSTDSFLKRKILNKELIDRMIRIVLIINLNVMQITTSLLSV